MLEGLYSAAAGMAAQEQQLDAIGNDLANASSTGYKSERVAFGDLLYNEVDMAGTVSSVGAGASAKMIGRNESQGAISLTGNPLDLAIEGEGYFQVKRPDGSTALTRDGTFSLNSAGQIVNAEGDSLIPPISLPSGTSLSDVMISSDGTVRASGHTLGQIKLVTVTSEDHLLNLGGELFAATTGSGEPHAVSGSTIHQGALEDSNVNVADEMTQMMSTQRSYQLASSAIQTESQMMSIANQLRS